MYSQTFLVTSVRAIFLPPQMAARLSESALGAKMPTPFFFMAALLMLVLPIRFFSAVIFFNVAFVSVVFFTVVVATVVFVVVVIAIEGGRVHASVEP